MDERKPWKINITPVGEQPDDDSAIVGLDFVRDHGTREDAREEGLRVLHRIQEAGGGNEWRIHCYRPQRNDRNGATQIIEAFYINPEEAN